MMIENDKDFASVDINDCSVNKSTKKIDETLYEEILRNTSGNMTSQINIALSKMILPMRANVLNANAQHAKGDYIFGNTSPTYQNIASALFAHGKLSVGELAGYTGINIRNMHRYLNVLEKDKYIKRTLSSNDKKVHIITATKKMANLYDAYAYKSYCFTDNLYNSHLTPEEQNSMLVALNLLGELFAKLAPTSDDESD
ncbi:MAG: MarR family winged helix-turn-helix transcriptional regulator [Clostridia bacterium]|nr:MarR family winged helix-turn-helix transcriptional regulator [Clostridia bacterium]